MSTDSAQKTAMEMRTYRGSSIAAGALFILCSAATILSAAPLGAPVSAPVDLAMVAANDNRVVMTALIEFVWVATGMGIAIAMYPVLKKFSPALALGSVVGRVVENVFILLGTLCLLVLLTVSQEAAGAAAATPSQVGDTLMAAREWVHGFVAMIPFGVGSLLYTSVLYGSRLVPRWLSGWGLVAIVSSLVAALYAGFTQDFGFTTVNVVLSAPIAFQEMALAVWLIAKGFSVPALTSVAVTGERVA